MLEACRLGLSRQSRLLFEDISFSLCAGQVLLLEGRNGTGKTSLLRILAGLAQADEGRVLWAGEAISASDSFKEQLLYIGHQAAVNLELTPLENLRYLCALHGEKSDSIWEILQAVGLAGYEDTPAGELSAGQQRRIALARLWLTQAKLWILDEPLTALDVKAVAGLEKRFAQHLADGGMLVVTTHQAAILPAESTIRLKLDESSEAEADS